MQIGSILIVGILSAMPFSPADQQPAAGDQPTSIRLNVNLVQLPATVTDSSGHSVPGLSLQAFRLLVDGVPQPITAFHGEDAPVTAGIVIDNSASMASKKSAVIAAALAFARGSNQLDQMFVVHFNNSARLGLPPDVPFTGDIAKLEAAISRFELGGTTSLYDALIFAQAQFRQAFYMRRVLLVITDGADNSSHATLSDILNTIQKGGVALFMIGLFDETDHGNPQVLTQLAESTGGRAFFPEAATDATKVCEEIAREIRRQYILGFAGAEDGKYHHVEVTAQDAKYGTLQVRTRPGYFASKP
jgi:Ca-activated chloride channel homolog